MPLRQPRRAGLLSWDGQETCYSVGDAGDYRAGLSKGYTVLTTGGYAGTSNIDVPHYAAATLAFVAATKKITDSANGLATVLTGDTIVIKGSPANEGTYTVATGGVAGEIVVNEALTDEAAGAITKIYKRAALSNNCVLCQRTGRWWARYTSDGLKHGIASDGKLNWYDAATCFTLHAAGADLQMIAASHTLRIVGGAGEVAVYDVGDPIVCSGFADADNNLPNWIVQSVTVSGADLDLVLGPTDSNKLADLASEAAGGNRDIKLVCRSIFGYCAAANAVSLGGFTDWRIPYDLELASLRNMEAPLAVPNAAAFPGWGTIDIWSSTTRPSDTSRAMYVNFNHGVTYHNALDTTYIASLVRG